MPATFPEVWLQRVRSLFTTQDQAPWLDGVEEFNTAVVELGSGTTSESNIIHIPVSDFDPEVLINNTTYPIALQAYTDDEVIIQLDKYQTKVTTLSDDQINGASYNVIDPATGRHVKSITKNKYRKAIHAIAPASDSTNTPVIVATGAVIGTRNRLTYTDLVTLKDRLDDIETPELGRRIVLSSNHFNDLLLDDSPYNKLLINYQNGGLPPNIAGFEIFQYVANPLYTSAGAKKAFGAVVASGDRKGSVAFLVDNIGKKTGTTKQYFAPASADPENQTNKLNYRHYYIALPVRNMYLGAIY